jgi:hypothetical protein
MLYQSKHITKMTDESELCTLEDILFDVGMEEGFCSSESVYDSDISETDSKADDYNDEDAWLELQCIDRCVNKDIEEEIDGEISLCTVKHVKNLGAVNRVIHDTSDTESETDNDEAEDDDNKQLVVRHFDYMSTLTECVELDLLDDVSVCCSDLPPMSLSSELREGSLSISGFELYIAFYSVALFTFLALEILSRETRRCIYHLCESDCRKCRKSFQPAEGLEHAIHL